MYSLEEMNIPEPKYFLRINNVGHGEMTGQMLMEIEKVLLNENPDLVLLYMVTLIVLWLAHLQP